MKLIQMLSMRSDLLPPEVVNILSVVQSSVPPMDYRLIQDQLKTELGASPEKLFKRFEHEAFAAASLGQVHKAQLKNGTDVVVKIQYPGVDKTVGQDLQNMQALLNVFTRLTRDVLRQKFEVDELYQEMQERLQEELDYVHEAKNINRFRHLFADDDEVIIPRMFPKFSSRRVLTMEYIDGYKFQDILAPGVDKELKDWVAIKYFQITWRQIFDFGVLHTDPQPGNYLVTYHPKLAMLDFGSVRVFPKEIRLDYLALAKAIVERDADEMARCFVSLGYLDPGDEPQPLIRIMYLIFEPVMEDRVYDPHDFHSAEKSIEVTAISLENRIFNAPGHRLFLVRALLGLEAYVQQFRTVTNWHRLFRECIERSEAAVQEN
jgi:predicted unusual protein kinase regulating ubiquinone biosynthesis (AarF/ABC1/UbiB family)